MHKETESREEEPNDRSTDNSRCQHKADQLGQQGDCRLPVLQDNLLQRILRSGQAVLRHTDEIRQGQRGASNIKLLSRVYNLLQAHRSRGALEHL